jgi:hypothetical protein
LGCDYAGSPDRCLLGQRRLQSRFRGVALGLGIINHFAADRLFRQQALGTLKGQLTRFILDFGTRDLRIGIDTNSGQLRSLGRGQTGGQQDHDLSALHAILGLQKG